MAKYTIFFNVSFQQYYAVIYTSRSVVSYCLLYSSRKCTPGTITISLNNVMTIPLTFSLFLNNIATHFSHIPVWGEWLLRWSGESYSICSNALLKITERIQNKIDNWSRPSGRDQLSIEFWMSSIIFNNAITTYATTDLYHSWLLHISNCLKFIS